MRKSSLFAALLLTAAARPAPAWWAQNQAVFGSGSLFYDQLGGGERLRPDLDLQAGYGVYNRDGSGGGAQNVWFKAARIGRDRVVGAKLTASPSHQGAGSYGALVFGDSAVETEEEMQSRFSWSAAALHHDLPLAYAGSPVQNTGMSELALSGGLEQSFFGLFELAAGAGYFIYDRRFGGLAFLGGSFDQGQAASLTPLRPLTDFPRWTLNFQMARKVDAGVDSVFYLGYSRIQLAGGFGGVDSALLGLDLKASTSLHLAPSFNLYLPGQGRAQRYFAVLVRYAP